jgi:Secretion system C-terminal sorting domain/Lamin Tail Domain
MLQSNIPFKIKLNPNMKNLNFLLIIFISHFCMQLLAQTPQPLPFTQNWTTTSLITSNDIWTGVPGIIGYLGDYTAASPTAVDPQTLLSDYSSTTVDVIANQANPNSNTTGGVAEFEITNPVVALQGSMAADAPFLLISINTSCQNNIKVQYNVRDIDGSMDNVTQPVALQYRIGNTGSFTNIPAGFIADATEGPSLAILVTAINVTLPGACNNQAEVQLRIITTNAVGSDEWIGIDDINITGEKVTIAPTAGTTDITEGGVTDSYSLVLNCQPTADVVINVNPDGQSTVSPTSLTFTTLNWNVAQSVTVTAVDDATIEGPHMSTILHTSTSTDVGFNGLSIPSLVSTVTDNDVPLIPCYITDISLSNMSACFDNATPLNSADDNFTADITITFSGKPATGTLNLSGDLLSGPLSAGVGTIGTTSYTFTGLNLAADGTPVYLTAAFSDDVTCSLTESAVTTAPSACSVIPDCSYPYFSEYVEGSSNNKCLEIYNPSSSPIDLAAGGYKIEMYFNGATGSGLTINLTGIILPGDVFVVCNSAATIDFRNLADQTASGGWYNGDDAIALIYTAGVLDVIGQIGVDPGANWSSSGIETSEQTLRRYSFLQKGDNNGSDAFNPAAEWETYAQNTLWGLGYHATGCQPSLPFGWNPVSIGCKTGTSSYNETSNTWTQTSNCFNPNSGADDLTFVFQELCGDREIIAQYMGVTPFGFAGLMMRENATALSKYVWLFNRANNNTSWGIRSVTGAAPLIQIKPHLYRTWMKLNRTDNVFRGYLSTDGITWQLIFQSALTMNDCLLVGIATHSNVDGNTVTSMFKNVNISGNKQRSAINQEDEMSLSTANRSVQTNTISVFPNPISDILSIDFNGSMVATEPTLMQIVDLNGRLVLQQTFENRDEDVISLDVSKIQAGIYFLKLSAGSFNDVIKVVKH